MSFQLNLKFFCIFFMLLKCCDAADQDVDVNLYSQVPLAPGIGQITNGVKVVGQNSKLILTSSMYNVVIVLDMRASMLTVVSFCLLVNKGIIHV